MSLTYDAAARPIRITEPLGDTDLTYSPTLGTLATASSPDGVDQTFDFDGNLLTDLDTTGPAPGNLDYSYDNDLRLLDSSISGQTLTYTYDNDSLLTSAGALQISRDTQTGLPTLSANNT